MQKKYACVRYLHSRITVYHACKIDLRHSKALHSCVTCRLLHLGLPCSAIHYGVCQAVNTPTPPQTPAPAKHPPGLKPVLAQKSKPISVPSAKPVPVPVPAPLPKPVSAPKPKPESGSVEGVSAAQASKAVSGQRTVAAVPIPVVPVARKVSPQAADMMNNNTWPLPTPKPAQPQPSLKPAAPPNSGYPHLGPARAGEQPPPAVLQSRSAQSAGGGGGGGGGQTATMVVHSVQPATPVVVRTSSGGSVTLPGGSVLVRTGSETGTGTPATNTADKAGGETRTDLLLGGDPGQDREPKFPTSSLDLNANTVDGGGGGGVGGTRTAREGIPVPVRSGAQDGTDHGLSGDARVVVTRMPSRAAACRPASVPNCGTRSFPFSLGEGTGEEGEKEKVPAFPVAPSDRPQTSFPASAHHTSPQSGRPQPIDLRPVNNDLTRPHPATTTTTTAITTAAITTITTTTSTTSSATSPTTTTVTPTTSITTTTASSTSLSSPTTTPPYSSQSPHPPLTFIPSSSTSSTELQDQRGSASSPKAKTPGDTSASSSTTTTTTTTTTTSSSPFPSSSSSSLSSKSTAAAGGAVTTTTSGRRGGVREEIPPFHFPRGKPRGRVEEEVAEVVHKAKVQLAQLDGERASREHMGAVAKACGFPLYWKSLLYRGAGGDAQGYVTLQTFSAMFHKLYSSCHDEASRFVELLARPGCMSLEFEDFVPLIQDIVDGHPGLSFLQDAPEFHSRYIHTVVSRIFFCVNRSWTGRITVPELRRSNFLRVLAILEDEDDINQVTDYFSYEHFYVIYCKFWELDKDHDLYIDREDLARHNDHALNSRLIDRIFSGAVTRGQDLQEGRMPYKEFVWFLIAEEDKKHPTSIEYWFRCMDLDGDGVVSMYEMEYFYEEQMIKMEALGIEKLPFHDCLCQMFDLVRPRMEEKITLSDLKNCLMADIFFDTFFNLDKFLEHEQRDPFAAAREVDGMGREISDWDRYAAEEYDILVAEEGLNEPEEIHFDEDLDMEDDDTMEEHVQCLTDPPQRNATPRLHPVTNDDIYDFATNDLGF